MSSHIDPIQKRQVTVPHFEHYIEAKKDHLWWLNDAARIVRTEAWDDLGPYHLRQLIEEIRDLQILLNNAWAYEPPDPLF